MRSSRASLRARAEEIYPLMKQMSPIDIEQVRHSFTDILATSTGLQHLENIEVMVYLHLLFIHKVLTW